MENFLWRNNKTNKKDKTKTTTKKAKQNKKFIIKSKLNTDRMTIEHVENFQTLKTFNESFVFNQR